jgi:hypothetical protein
MNCFSEDKLDGALIKVGGNFISTYAKIFLLLKGSDSKLQMRKDFLLCETMCQSLVINDVIVLHRFCMWLCMPHNLLLYIFCDNFLVQYMLYI